MKKVFALIVAALCCVSVYAEDLGSIDTTVMNTLTEKSYPGSVIFEATPNGVKVTVKGLIMSASSLIPADEIKPMITKLGKARKWADICTKKKLQVATKMLGMVNHPYKYGTGSGLGFAFFSTEKARHCGVALQVLDDKTHGMTKMGAALSIDDVDTVIKILKSSFKAIKKEKAAVDAADLLD